MKFSRFRATGAYCLFCLIFLALASHANAQTRPLGTDVSSFQGSSINWTTMKTDGIYFAWAKAAEGAGTDGYIGQDADFTANEAHAKAADVPIGAYYFARPSADPNITGANSADTEAQFFWSVASNYVKAGGSYLVPMLDWEDPNVTNVPSLTTAKMSQWVNEWCNDVSNYAYATGIVLQPVVYTGSWYSEPGTYPGLNSSVTIWPSWVASYPSCTLVGSTEECGDTSPEVDTPNPAYPWNYWNIWQYGDTNWSGGDADVFNGTTNQFIEQFVVGGPLVVQTASAYWDSSFLKASPGSGGTGTWSGATNNWWVTGSVDSVWPANGCIGTFAGTAGTVTLAAEETASGLAFNTTGYTITGTGQQLVMSGAGTITVSSGVSATVACILGGEAFNLTGGGSMTLNNNNNWSEGETITGPNTTLIVPTDHPLGNDGVTLNIVSGGIYQDNDATSGDQFLLPGCAVALGSGGGIFSNPNGNLSMTNYITGSGSLTVTAGSGFTLTLTDTGNTYTGGTIIQSGTLKANAAGVLGSTSGALTASGGGLNLNGASFTAGTVTISGGAISNGTLTGSSYAGQSGTVSAVLAGTGAMTKTTTGTLTLSGANTYSGITTISSGLLQVGADNNLGTAPGSAVANKITLNGGISAGLRCTSSFTLNAKRGMTLTSPNGGSLQATTSQTLTYGGIITGGGPLGIGSSDTLGYGVTVLSGANNYTGGTTIAAGTLRLGASGTLPSGTAMTIGSDQNTGGGGILDLNGFNQTIGTLTSSTGIGGTGTDLPTIKLTGNLTILESNSTTFSGAIIGSGGNLTINGATELILTGTNTYTGATTVSAGTLGLSSTGSISNSSSISLAAGTTLDTSSISSFILSSSTSFSASGTSSPATITGRNAVSLGSQPITLTYDGSHPALTISQGILSLNGNAFTVNGAALAPGSYVIVQDTSAGIAGSGSFSVSGTAIGAGTTGAITVSGQTVVLTITAATTTVIGALTPSNYGQSATITAMVAPAPPGGTVQFYDNGIALGSPVGLSSGLASYSTSALAVGTHPITATYSGTTYYTGSTTSGPSNQVVNPAPVNVTANPQTKQYGQTLAFGPGSTNFTSSGLVNGDTIGSVTLAVSGSGGTATAPVGAYTITPSAATNGTFSPGNYNFSYLTNALTVTLPPNTIPVTITGVTLAGNGGASMTFSGTPGYVYWIEGATNLTTPIVWTILSTNAADSNGNFSFTDALATNYGARFYQTVATPSGP